MSCPTQEDLETRAKSSIWRFLLHKSPDEEKVFGRFWQGRYKAVRILDEESLLACAAYIDLNPIRAAFKNVAGTAKSVSEARSLETHRKFYRARV